VVSTEVRLTWISCRWRASSWHCQLSVHMLDQDHTRCQCPLHCTSLWSSSPYMHLKMTHITLLMLLWWSTHNRKEIILKTNTINSKNICTCLYCIFVCCAHSHCLLHEKQTLCWSVIKSRIQLFSMICKLHGSMPGRVCDPIRIHVIKAQHNLHW